MELNLPFYFVCSLCFLFPTSCYLWGYLSPFSILFYLLCMYICVCFIISLYNIFSGCSRNYKTHPYLFMIFYHFERNVETLPSHRAFTLPASFGSCLCVTSTNIVSNSVVLFVFNHKAEFKKFESKSIIFTHTFHHFCYSSFIPGSLNFHLVSLPSV